MSNRSESTLEDRFAAVNLQYRLFTLGHCLPLSLANRLAVAGYIKTTSAAMTHLNPFLRKGFSASEAALKVLAMESPETCDMSLTLTGGRK